jgi:hypothetical protein
MGALLNKIFPKSNPFGEDAWWEIYPKKAEEIKIRLQAIFCKKKIEREREARKAKKQYQWERFHDRRKAAELRRKWEEEDKPNPKPGEPETLVVGGAVAPYGKICSYNLRNLLKQHDGYLYRIESNPEAMAFIRANWENKDDFDQSLSDCWLEFPDSSHGYTFNNYLRIIRTRDNIAKELIGRYIGAKNYPWPFIKPSRQIFLLAGMEKATGSPVR